MHLDRVRKRAWFGAIAALVIGAAGLLVIGGIYAAYGGQLNVFIKQESNPTSRTVYLIKALKAFAFIVSPGFCLALVGSGLTMLDFLKQERKVNRSQ